VQRGGAGARQAGDEDRPLDRDVGSVLRKRGFAEQPRDQRAAQFGALDLVAVRRELLVVGIRVEQHVERLEVLVAAEVGQPDDLARRRLQILDGTHRVPPTNGGTHRS
jgi:hypothetical protein